MADEKSEQLLALLRLSASEAEHEVFDRYAQRLVDMARKRMSPKLRRRVDPEDIVQSACGSFFVRARDGSYVWRRAGDLWRLLAAITLHKLHGQVERHTAARRSVFSEVELRDPTDREAEPAEPSDHQPTGPEAVAVVEQLTGVMQASTETERRVLQLRLQGRSIESVAGEIGRSQRTVRRMLLALQRNLEQELECRR